MTKPRVLMVTRRYWPHVADDAGCRLASLAGGLRRYGIHSEVIAARFAASWPTELTYRESWIHRPAPAPKGDWSMARYQRGLSNALNRMAASFDVLYADSMREEGAAVVEAARRVGRPSVVRFSGVAEQSDAVWWQTGRSGRRCRSACLSADILLATRGSAEQALVAAGADRKRICRIDDGFPAAPLRDTASWQAAVTALSDINADLHIPERTRVVLCTNRLTQDSGAAILVEALPTLLQRVPDTQVWMIGDGPWRSRLYDRVRQQGFSSRVAMPGSFSSLDELLTAADLFVHPHVADGMEYHLPRALGAGLPVVVSSAPETKRMLGDAMESVTTFSPGDPAALAASVEHALTRLPAQVDIARQLRQTLLATRPLSSAIESHAKLFQRLTAESHAASRSDASRVEPAQ
ncbi:MAG: glycosyltransferase family 4 protein [Pirellulaceae bacterium]